MSPSSCWLDSEVVELVCVLGGFITFAKGLRGFHLSLMMQVRVLQEQLLVEAGARNDAQVRVQRLLQQNTDLLQHISLLVRQIQELEIKANGRLTSGECLSRPFPSPVPIFSGVTSPLASPPSLHSFMQLHCGM